MNLIALSLIGLTVVSAPPKKGGKPKAAPVEAPDAGPPEPPPKREIPAGYPNIDALPFTPASIQSVVAHHLPQVQTCYEQSLATKEKAVGGSLMTSFVIMPNGNVKKAAVVKKGTTVKDPKLNECVVGVLNAMMFPVPPDGADHPIEYPINLKAIE